VRAELYHSLDSNLGATMRGPWYREPAGYQTRRFEMDNGDVALFCWTDDVGYWIGNTETPSALWRTDKETFAEAPAAVAEWAERELLATLYEEAPWIEEYPNLAEFFLPVLLSKDGRHTSRAFLHEHAAGFPEVDADAALSFYDEFLARGVLTDRHAMAGKLGTAEHLDLERMSAAMSEYTVAKLLSEVGYDVLPEVEISTGHVIDFAVKDGDGRWLIEVTRPVPTERRTAGSPVTALRETVRTKTGGQLAVHGGGVTLFVDCSSFDADDWAAIRLARPDPGHRPAVVCRVRPGESVEGYTAGSVPIRLPDGID